MGTTETSTKASGGIQGEREIIQEVTKALTSNHYLILITALDQEEKELTHFRSTRNFPYRDITPVLAHYNEEFRKDKLRSS